MTDVEQLLRSALAPVEPSSGFNERLEARLEELDTRLSELTDAAADELADWEITSMRDPRNWGRPVAATAVVGLAGAGLIALRARQHSSRSKGTRDALERAGRDVADQVRRRLER